LAGDEGDRWSNPDRGDVGKGMVPGAGEGDADGEEAAEDGRCGDSGVLFPAVLSPTFLKRFKREYLDPSLRGTLGTRSGSGSASCPADLGLREPEGEGTGRSS
jgi:hypothetical protein